MSNLHLTAPSLTVTIPRRVRFIVAGVLAVVLVVGIVLATRAIYDHTHTPDYPAAGVQDWATFSDHLIVGRVTGKDTFLVTTVLWTRQGATTAPRRIIWLDPPAGLVREKTYALPVLWVTDHGKAHWAPLSSEAVLRLDGDRLAEHTGGDTWAAEHGGDRPQELAAELYAKGPYPAAVPHLYQSVDSRVDAVKDR